MVDTPETLAAELARAGARAAAVVRPVVAKGAVNIKNEAKRNVLATAPRRNAHAHTTITYDMTSTVPPVLGAQIGYDKDLFKAADKRTGPGGLGNVLEYGSVNNPPHRDLGRAADAEEPRFQASLALAIARLL